MRKTILAFVAAAFLCFSGQAIAGEPRFYGQNIFGIPVTFADITVNDQINLIDGTDTHIIKAVRETGLGGRLTIGLDETARTMVICDAGDIDVDFDLAASSEPLLAIFDAGGTLHSHITYYGIYLNTNAFTMLNLNRTTGPLIFNAVLDHTAGDMFNFKSTAASEFTDTDGQQSWLSIEPKINQSGTAAYDALKVNVLETTPGTSIGDGSTGDGNNLFNLALEGVSKFRVSRTGVITAQGQLFKTIEKTTDASLTVLECSDTLITNRGWTGAADMTLTLPDADTVVGAGLKFKFLNVVTDAAEDVYIDTEGSTTKIYLNGSPGADGHRIWLDNPTIGESIVCHTFTLDGTTYDWACDSINGDWMDKGS